jgi:hypothetical protein
VLFRCESAVSVFWLLPFVVCFLQLLFDSIATANPTS